jgi:hypothetical protein
MAASIKISELNSLTDLTDVDLFLVSDMETGTSRKISYTNLKSNVITETTSALSDLENVVSQNKLETETLVDTVRVSLQTSVDLINNGLDARVNILETDPVTKTYVDNKVTEVIGGAPETLDTLSELADTLGDNPHIITNLQSQLDDYIAHIEARNLEAALAEGTLYSHTLFGG